MKLLNINYDFTFICLFPYLIGDRYDTLLLNLYLNCTHTFSAKENT